MTDHQFFARLWSRRPTGSRISSQRGATAIEYALIASLIALVLITSLGLIGTELSGFFDMVAVEMAAPAPGR
jgi:pilus assembly protein Flp/PilA